MRYIIAVLLTLISVSAYAGVEIRSDAFTSGGAMPSKYSCDDKNVSPALSWTGIPNNARSLVLICEDPDAPGNKPWSHWVMFNIPKSSTGLQKDVDNSARLPDGSIQGLNDFGRTGWDGPCPPWGTTHRYFFKLYVLNATLTLDMNASREDVLKAMNGYILAETSIYGTYKRQVAR